MLVPRPGATEGTRTVYRVCRVQPRDEPWERAQFEVSGSRPGPGTGGVTDPCARDPRSGSRSAGDRGREWPCSPRRRSSTSCDRSSEVEAGGVSRRNRWPGVSRWPWWSPTGAGPGRPDMSDGTGRARGRADDCVSGWAPARRKAGSGCDGARRRAGRTGRTRVGPRVSLKATRIAMKAARRPPSGPTPVDWPLGRSIPQEKRTPAR